MTLDKASSRRTAVRMCIRLAVGFGLSAGAAGMATAQSSEWPTRPVQLVVPFAAGGPFDVTTRSISVELARLLGRPVVVENAPGASGKIALQRVAGAQDGHTFLMANTGLAVPTLLDRRTALDFTRDFKPVVPITKVPFFLVTNSQSPFSNVRELVNFALANPKKLNFGSLGAQTPPYFLTEMLKVKTGMDLVHIPYKGNAPAVLDLVGNTIQLYFMGSGKQAQSDSRLRILAVTSRERWPDLPDTPTFEEQGVPGMLFEIYNGVFAPANIPDAHVRRLNAAINTALGVAGVRAPILDIGYQITGGTPEALGTRVQAELEVYKGMIARGELKAEE